jgi:Rad3-related DNA helicase
MAKNMNPKYINAEGEIRDYIEEDAAPPAIEDEQETAKDTIVRERKVFSGIASPVLAEEDIEFLKRDTPRVAGSIFDRVGFLRQRIAEIEDAIALRKQIHEDIASDIKEDMREKENIESSLSDMTEKRNFRMDISLLRKEMRAENVRFWKDILELSTELRELLEQYQTESKIAGMFRGVGERV